ncbi:MAG: GxxExxY protein [Anaerolineales bacterium]|nr:GxxExxY protein [Chloroflexota bacterium]MBL6980077.1 GxxExxY protein [Anaerolineales bacterium]
MCWIHNSVNLVNTTETRSSRRFVLAEKVVLEIKAVEAIAPVHEAQLLTYLKLRECKVGLLINFNVPILKERHS